MIVTVVRTRQVVTTSLTPPPLITVITPWSVTPLLSVKTVSVVPHSLSSQGRKILRKYLKLYILIFRCPWPPLPTTTSTAAPSSTTMNSDCNDVKVVDHVVDVDHEDHVDHVDHADLLG